MTLHRRMKRLLVLAGLLSSFSFAGRLPDVLDTPALPTALAPTRLLNGIAPAGTRLVAAGQRGHIIYSDDGGKTWTQAQVPVRSDLVAVKFISPLRGWAVGHDGVVLASDDGGASWRKQLDGRQAAQALKTLADSLAAAQGDARLIGELQRMAAQGADKPFLDVWFQDERSGYAVGAFGLIFRTGDGGATWQPWLHNADNPGLLHLYAIDSAGDDVFAVGEQGLLLKLDKPSGRFRAQPSPYKGSFFGVTGRAGAVLVFGLRGNLFRSRDGGASWQKIETATLAGLTGGSLLGKTQVALVSQGGELLISHDDGLRFAPLPLPRRFPFTALAPTATGALAITGLRGVVLQPLTTETGHGRP